ncbi:HYR domain-containing protein [Aequorivita sp. CIP111184]|uniref:HYR domain-containing protein n=1 Tax=Aequorivita sp. CIP111184 TaxID=2211356 RepID=UPI000DBBEFB5|nr:HYR domain-containing protein [Aequorivita sp. CIP111184]SRX53805.1 hypothetical protein AEQU1_00885 [Aequorivita sp. CIP111184]
MKQLTFLWIVICSCFFLTQKANAQCTSTNYDPETCSDYFQIVPTVNGRSNSVQNFMPSFAPGDLYYINSTVGNPWGNNTNQVAMDSAFGAGNWTQEFFETLNAAVVFAAPTKFVFIDGSDSNATELDAFLVGNLPAIEAWVNNGGTLLLNSAPNEAGNINFGFGGTTLVYPNESSSVSVVNTSHPVFIGPNTPTATPMTGGNYSHASITGTGYSNLLVDSTNPAKVLLAEKAWGAGRIMVGGMTTVNFHSPNPAATNWRINLLVYMESLAINGPIISCPGDITVSNDPGICGAVVNYTVTASSSTSTIPPQDGFGNFTKLGAYNGHTYYVSNNPMNGSAAFADALSNGGYVATINDAAENTYINNAVLATIPGLDVLLGLNDLATEGSFEWQNGDPLGYTNWNAGEPNDAGGNEDYAVMFTTGLWNDVQEVTPHRYVLEIDATFEQTAGLPSGSTFPVGTTTNTFEVTDSNGTSSCSFDVTVNDTEVPVFADIYGDGTLTNPFTSLLPEIVGSVTSGTYYFAFNGSTFQGVLDNDTDGGGWLMILNYVHQAGDNSVLEVRNTDLPLLGASTLGTSEAASPSWGHFGNVLAADIDFEEVRFFGQTSRDLNNVIDFTTDFSAVLDYVKTGTGSFSGINNPANYTLGANHNASIPQNAPDFFSNEGDFALTNFPFWRNGQAHWGVRGAGNRWEVDDFTINSFSTIHRVWVKGDLSPTFNNENVTITVQLDGSGNVTVSPADFGLTTADNCGAVTQTLSITDFDCSDIGSNTIQLTATDGAGNETTIDVIVNVEDTEAPVITCVADTTRDTDSGVCQYTIVGTEFDATFTDNCTSGSITNDFNGTDTLAGEILPTGDTTVIWNVDDGNGQTATCTTVITVEDNEAPIIACPVDITANTSAGNCFSTVSFSMPYTQDNCGIDTVVQTMGDPSGSQFPVGVNTIEFTATDVNGNVSTCSFTITVIDNEAPVAVCQNITIQLDAAGNAAIVAADVDGGSTDQCGVATISIDMDTFDCSNVGDNNVILTVTDVNGNTSTCTAIVTVEDVTAPVVACQNLTVELDPLTGTVTIAGTDIDNGSTDTCGIASYDLDIDTFDCSNIGDNTVVLTVTDVNGNTETCTAIVTVEDNTSPVLVCQDFTLELGADGTATLDPSDVIASNDDACGIFTVAVDITQFSCTDIGTPVTVQIFSQDNNGNLATCTAVVTVVDNLAPVVTCPADQTVDPGQGNLFYIVPDYFATGEATAVDNCTDPVTVTTQDPAAGTTLSDGTYTIMLTATDAYGNTGTCEFELVVDSVLGTGGNNQSLGSIAMYPNPAKGNVTIGNPQSLELERADIYDLTGRLVQSFNLKGMATAKTLNVDNLAAATYVVIIKGKNGQITKRLLKE